MTKIFFTAQEVADMLKLNILTIYEYIKKGELPAIKFGRNYRIEEKKLNEFIKKNEVQRKI